MIWSTIDSAPKDKILLLYAVSDISEDGTIRNWSMETGYWNPRLNRWIWGPSFREEDSQPTHWMVLPKPPHLYNGKPEGRKKWKPEHLDRFPSLEQARDFISRAPLVDYYHHLYRSHRGYVVQRFPLKQDDQADHGADNGACQQESV